MLCSLETTVHVTFIHTTSRIRRGSGTVLASVVACGTRHCYLGPFRGRLRIVPVWARRYHVLTWSCWRARRHYFPWRFVVGVFRSGAASRFFKARFLAMSRDWMRPRGATPRVHRRTRGIGSLFGGEAILTNLMTRGRIRPLWLSRRQTNCIARDEALEWHTSNIGALGLSRSHTGSSCMFGEYIVASSVNPL